MRIPRTLAIVLAGGKGSRLGSLTDDTVKPALPFAGPYRLIDIALSNLAHSHISDVWIAEQYLPHSLNDHLAQGRPWDLDRLHGGLQVLAPFEGATGEGMAQGNSDTLWRHRERIRSFGADHVLVLSADHVYTLDFLEVMATHTTSDADLTVVTTRVDEDPSSFSVVQVDDSGRVIDFDYKPDEPQGNLVAAEVFLYRAQTLLDALDELGGKTGGLGDYGEDLLPHLVSTRLVVEHRLDGYWRDLGTIDSYWRAHMEILDGNGAILDDPAWPIWTAQPQLVPARIEPEASVRGSMVSSGSRVSGSVEHSILGPAVVVEEGASVVDSVVLHGAHIGPGVELVRCVVATGARVVGGTRRGSEDRVTLIGPDGTITDRA